MIKKGYTHLRYAVQIKGKHSGKWITLFEVPYAEIHSPKDAQALMDILTSSPECLELYKTNRVVIVCDEYTISHEHSMLEPEEYDD